jgi:hypothetical protein
VDCGTQPLALAPAELICPARRREPAGRWHLWWVLTRSGEAAIEPLRAKVATTPSNDMARGDLQTNIRLSPERYAILEAAAFVHRAGTPTKLVELLVDEAVDRLAKLPTVQKALEAQREQGAADEGSCRIWPRSAVGQQRVPRAVRHERWRAPHSPSAGGAREHLRCGQTHGGIRRRPPGFWHVWAGFSGSRSQNPEAPIEAQTREPLREQEFSEWS